MHPTVSGREDGWSLVPTTDITKKNRRTIESRAYERPTGLAPYKVKTCHQIVESSDHHATPIAGCI